MPVLPFSVVYVISSDGADAFADMALVSMLSVRISNPGLGILAVCDEKSAITLRANKHRMLDVCDQFITVPTPDGEPTFRSRWIKTQLCRYVEGNILNIDADTLVRGSLADLQHLVSDFGAVANHNGATLSEQIWSEDHRANVARLMVYFGCEEQDQLKRASYESDHSIDYSARSRRANRLEAISSVSRNRGQRRRLFVSCLSAGSRALSASSPHPSRGRDFANARGRSEPHPAADAFL